MKTRLIIFGITGDLSRRKLLPALDEIIASGDVELEIIGVSRRHVSVEELLVDSPRLQPITSMFTMDLSNPEDYTSLSEFLGADDSAQRLYYLSVPPGAAASIADFLGEAGLNTNRDTILFEKPFGYDRQSAQEFIDRTAVHYKERQLFRIDHYMAKEVAREIIALRQDAESRHYYWNAATVESVKIVAHEKIGVEGRAEFYEQTGAIRDVVQGHLMQLLSLVLMDPAQPNIPLARLAALRQLRPVLPDDVKKDQYEGYPQEVGVTRSETETYAKLTLFSDDPRWSDVPFILETGKKMPGKQTYVRINYKDGTSDIFDESTLSEGLDSRLQDAYERVLLAAMRGDRSIFTSSEEVLESWRVIDPAQD